MTTRFLEDYELFKGTAVVSGGSGDFSLDISAAEFERVQHVSLTVKAGDFSDAKAPLSTTLKSHSVYSVEGKAFKATSAGLLAAMQQTAAEDGTEIDVLVIGQLEEYIVYKTIEKFLDSDGRVYEVGDVYPRQGLEVDQERIKQLASTDNKINRAVIVAEKKRKPRKKVTDTEE